MSSIFFDALRKISSSKLSEIAVYSERCIDLCHKTKELCSVCQENCVTDAIKIDGGVEIDWSRCVKCGVCAAVCPTEVFEIQAPSDNMILREIGRRPAKGRVRIECDFVNGEFRGEKKHLRSKDRKIVVPCLGRFSETLLLQSILVGGDQVEFTECTSDCRFSTGRSIVAEMRQRAERLLKAFEAETQKDRMEEGETGDVSGRRDLLRKTGWEAIGIFLPRSARSVEPSDPRDPTPPRRADLIELVKEHLPLSSRIDRERMPFGGVEIDPQKCRLHGVCASVCPTGALRIRDDNQGKELIFRYGACVGCEVCVHACPEDALKIGEKIDLAQLSAPWKTLTGKNYRLCTSCGRQFTVKMGADSTVCPSCTRRWETIERYAEDSAN